MGISNMKKQTVWLMAALAALALAGCANDKGPAEQAIANADAALAQIHDAALKYIPEQLGAVTTQLDSLKDAANRGDYKAVLAAAPAVMTAIGALKDSANAKQAEVEAALAKAKDAWGPMSTDLPKMVDAIQTRVDTLSKSHRLPKGITKSTLATAQTSLGSLKSAWGDASNDATTGDYTSAVNKAQALKDQAAQIMQSLGMSSS
jgi:predicted small lipoprotein YifL